MPMQARGRKDFVLKPDIGLSVGGSEYIPNHHITRES